MEHPTGILFSNIKGRCNTCGGALSDYDIAHGVLNHIDKSDCIYVLQNTLILHNMNTDVLSERIGKMFEIVTLLIDNSDGLDQELLYVLEGKCPIVWEDAGESSHAHICHMQLMERIRRELNEI